MANDGSNTDTIFGTRVHATFDPFQILGIQHPPEGTDWELNLDYMSKRGIGYGTKFAWREPETFLLQAAVGARGDDDRVFTF